MSRLRHGFPLTLAALALLLFGCSGPDMMSAKQTTGRAPTLAEVPGADETVRGEDDPPIVTLEMGSHLRERRMSENEKLPGDIIVPTTNLNAVPVTTALQAVLAGSDVSLSWAAGTFDDRLVTVTNLSGSLPRVVEKICTSAKVFCAYHHGLLELKDKETFIIDLPSVPTKSGSTTAAANTMADAIGDMAGEKARVDQQGGNLIYTTDVEGQERVRQYLEALRNGRPLVVMQLYIWEVTLNRENGTGINWKSFSFAQPGPNLGRMLLSGSTAFTSLSSPGVSLGAKFAGNITADTMLQFLATQGQVQTISNPQLTFVSGSSADFRVGGKQRYISQVGQVTTSSVTGAGSSGNNSNGNASTNTVSTDSLDTGLTVQVSGSYEGGIISAILDLALQDVISLNPTTSGGGTIDLPETSERKVNTTIRVRPGDNLVMAGLVTSRDTNTRDGIPLPFNATLPTSSDNQYKNTELVILVKPSVVLFSDAGAAAEERQHDQGGAERTASDSNKPKPSIAATELPDAVMIDKDGAQTLKVPETAGAPLRLQAPASTKPELMVPAAYVKPIGNTPVATGADDTPVDRRMLQRGFSHAFDELLAPVSEQKTAAEAAKAAQPELQPVPQGAAP